MSERYQTCPSCRGRGYKLAMEENEFTKFECGRCGGTGSDGDAMAPREFNYYYSGGSTYDTDEY